VSYRFSEAYSGLSLERPELDKLRELVRTKAIDVVVCHSLDRLTRDPGHGVIITQEMEKHHVTLEAVTEDIDNSELGKLISYIRGFAAKLETEKTKERTMRGKRALLKEGKLPQGTGVGMYGYDWNKENKTRQINQEEAKVVNTIFERVANGDSLISIARRLNQSGIPTKATKKDDNQRKFWHSLTIRRIIRNSGYTGNTYFKDILLPDVSPAIVSEEVFQAANVQLDRPKVRNGRPKNEYLLKEHAYCAICGKPLVGHCLNKKYRYYQCSNARPYENAGKKCQARYIRAGDLEKMVWEKTQAVLMNPEIVLSQLAEASDIGNLDALEADIKELNNNLRKYEQRRSNLLEALELGVFGKDEVLDRLNNLKRLQHEDEARLNDLTKTRDNITNLAEAKVKLGNFYEQVMEKLQDSSPEIIKLALDALDIKVYASTDKIEIQGIIPLELALPTTARTWGCLIVNDYNSSTGKECVNILPRKPINI